MFPESYSAPAGWYRNGYDTKMESDVPTVVLTEMRRYYTELLMEYPDVVTAQVVSKLTGYSKTAVNNWCNKGELKSFKRRCENHIPKIYLIEFFCSERFRTITRKSLWHIRTLKDFSRWTQLREL